VFDPSYRVDDYFSAEDQALQDPSYLEAVAWCSQKTFLAITRYERRLARKVSANEGQMLMRHLHAPDPQGTLPRFFRCCECGGWGDRGKLKDRRTWETRPLCDGCGIPF
jgi:hypothetical protein